MEKCPFNDLRKIHVLLIQNLENAFGSEQKFRKFPSSLFRILLLYLRHFIEGSTFFLSTHNNVLYSFTLFLHVERPRLQLPRFSRNSFGDRSAFRDFYSLNLK